MHVPEAVAFAVVTSTNVRQYIMSAHVNHGIRCRNSRRRKVRLNEKRIELNRTVRTNTELSPDYTSTSRYLLAGVRAKTGGTLLTQVTRWIIRFKSEFIKPVLLGHVQIVALSSKLVHILASHLASLLRVDRN